MGSARAPDAAEDVEDENVYQDDDEAADLWLKSAEHEGHADEDQGELQAWEDAIRKGLHRAADPSGLA